MSKLSMDFPIIFAPYKARGVYSIFNAGEFNKWINVDIDIPMANGGTSSVLALQLILNDQVCCVCSLMQFIHRFNLFGNWKIKYEGKFPSNFKTGNAIDISEGDIGRLMKYIDILIHKYDTKIAYLDTRIDQIMYIVQFSESKLGYITLLRNERGENPNGR